MTNAQMLTEIIAEVKTLPIEKEVEKHMELTRRQGSNLLGLCPFHEDTRIGSFLVSETKQRYSCYACGAGAANGGPRGDLIDFRANFKRIEYRQAALEIALENGIINGQTFNALMNKKEGSFSKIEVKTTEKTEKKAVKQRHGGRILNAVYNVYLDCCELSEEHRRDLKEKRHLTDEVIEERKYRTNAPRGRQFMENLEEKLKEKEELTGMKFAEILGSTPGFFRHFDHDTWNWATHYTSGLLIPTKNELGQIAGLQIRLDEKKDGGPRYIWFTSGFAEEEQKYVKCGTGAGISLDVIYPKNFQSKALFITEGRFKAESVVDKIGAVVISVPGVGNYRGIEEMIKRVEEETKRRAPAFLGFNTICIAFDSDAQTNDAVSKSRESMRKTIAKTTTTPIYYITWDDEYKGIDDFLYSEEAEKANDFRKLMRAQKM